MERNWTRSRDLELRDAVSILQVEPERLGNMWDAYDLLKSVNEERINMLSTQIELFEAERTQLVEAAFKSEKDKNRIQSQFTDMENQRNGLRDLLAIESEMKNKYFMAQKNSAFFQSVSVVSLIAVLILTIMVFR